MARRPIVRIVAAVLGGLFVTVALMGILIIVNSGDGFSGSTANAFGWALPLITGGVVGVVSWMLLAETDTASTTEPRSRATTCRKCGSRTLNGWRLCPYCGSFLDRGEMTAAAGD